MQKPFPTQGPSAEILKINPVFDSVSVVTFLLDTLMSFQANWPNVQLVFCLL